MVMDFEAFQTKQELYSSMLMRGFPLMSIFPTTVNNKHQGHQREYIHTTGDAQPAVNRYIASQSEKPPARTARYELKIMISRDTSLRGNAGNVIYEDQPARRLYTANACIYYT
jgi:hypothetical protein